MGGNMQDFLLASVKLQRIDLFWNLLLWVTAQSWKRAWQLSGSQN